MGCAIGGHEGVIASAQCAKGRRHAENLTPAIEFICAQSQIELSEISVIAVDLGPGLFTGLRVGIATGKGLAHALGVPMIGVASLDLLAFAGAVLVPPDRRRRSTPVAASSTTRFYRQVPGGIQRLGEHSVGSPEELVSELLGACARRCCSSATASTATATCSNRARRSRSPMPGSRYPSAASLVQLAHAQALREEFEQPTALEPIYLRKPDAEINWVTRDRALTVAAT